MEILSYRIELVCKCSNISKTREKKRRKGEKILA